LPLGRQRLFGVWALVKIRSKPEITSNFVQMMRGPLHLEKKGRSIFAIKSTFYVSWK
jgi:hypothetical protein